jgi:hypothetical protein
MGCGEVHAEYGRTIRGKSFQVRWLCAESTKRSCV